MFTIEEAKKVQEVWKEMYLIKPITYDAPLEVMALPTFDDCPAEEARHMESLTVHEPEFVSVYETGNLGAEFYAGVLPDGGRVLAA